MNPSENLNETVPPPKPRRNILGPSQEAACYALVFGLALLLIGLFSSPWETHWRAPSNIEASATNFIADRGEQPAHYRLARAVRYHPDGLWSGRKDWMAFSLYPTFTHQLRLERTGWDTWFLELNQDGRIVRLSHTDEEGAMETPLRKEEAREYLSREVIRVLGISLDSLGLEAETLRTQIHNSEYLFEYRWPQVLGENRKLRLALAGEHLSEAAIVENENGAQNENWPWGNRGEFWRRLVGAFLIFAVTATVFIRHPRPLAWRPALLWGGVVLCLVFAEHLLRVNYCEVSGFSNIYLASLIEAFQAACIIGLVIAAAESLAREQLPNVATLTRPTPSQRHWADAWMSATRAAMPCVLGVLVIETLFSVSGKPVGFMRVAANELAYAVSAPVPLLAAILQTVFHAIWHEGIFRFFALLVILSFTCNRIAAIVISAIAAVLFGASGALGWNTLLWLVWAVVAAELVLRAGIRAAFLFHLLVLGGHISLLLLWTGWLEAGWAGGVLVGIMLIGIFSMGVWVENNRRLAS